MHQELIEGVNRSQELKKSMIQVLEIIQTSSNDSNVVEKTASLLKLIKELNVIDAQIILNVQELSDEYYSQEYDILYYSDKKTRQSVLLRNLKDGFAIVYVNNKDRDKNQSFGTVSQIDAVTKYHFLLSLLLKVAKK